MSETKMPDDEVRAEIILYQSDGQDVPVQVHLMDDTLWMPQREIADLFETSQQNVSLHIRNIYETGELDEAATHKKILSVRKEGSREVRRELGFYNLDVIIAVGYRVSSLRATRFRQWATSTLREYITKGFVLNDEMLKNGRPFGKDYFDELLARIRDIRASERRVWLKITDIFQECSFDYDPNSRTARDFYATVQNKMHYAATGHTAAEIIMGRADASLPNMGLTTWKGAPEGRIHSSDVVVAKNYLREEEIDTLNRLVTMMLDDIELRARDGVLTSMEDCARAVDGFLEYSRRDVLRDKGERNRKQAHAKARAEFAKFQRAQDAAFENDFQKRVGHMGDGS